MCQGYFILPHHYVSRLQPIEIYNTALCGMLILMFQGTCYQVGRWRQQVPAKYWWPSTKLSDTTSQKTVVITSFCTLFHFQDNCVCLPLPLCLYSLGMMYKELQYTRNSSSFFTWKLTALICWIVCVCVCVHACMRTWMCTIGGLVSNETMHTDPDLGCWSPK
jgi:hypothetical protein